MTFFTESHSPSSSSNESLDSGYASTSKPIRRHRKGRMAAPIEYTFEPSSISFDYTVEWARSLPRLPRSFLNANPDLAAASVTFSRRSSQLSRRSISASSVSSMSADEESFARTSPPRRGSVELELRKTERHHCEADSDSACTQCRLERALAFAAASFQDADLIPDGLKTLLSQVNADDL